jgi:hypothetical protein
MVDSIVYTLNVRGEKVHLIDVTYGSWFMFPKDKEEWTSYFDTLLDFLITFRLRVSLKFAPAPTERPANAVGIGSLHIDRVVTIA